MERIETAVPSMGTRKSRQEKQGIANGKTKKTAIETTAPKLCTRAEYKKQQRILKLKRPLLKAMAAVTIVGGVAVPVISATSAEAATTTNSFGPYAHYKVQKGDTLTKIGKTYHVKAWQLTNVNRDFKPDFNPDRLSVGEDVIVPNEDNQGNIIDPSSPPLEPGEKIHLIQKGETIEQISSQYNESVQKIEQDNPVVTDGGKLIVARNLDIKPDGKGFKVSKKTYTMLTKKHTATVKTTSKKYTVAKQSATYKVVKGDTLGIIAALHNTTVKELKSLNNLTSDRIYAGQVLIVSGKASVKKPAANQQLITVDEAVAKLKTMYPNFSVRYDHTDSCGNIVIQVCQFSHNMTETLDWFTINPKTGKADAMFDSNLSTKI